MLVLITFPETDIGTNMDCIEKSDIVRFFSGEQSDDSPAPGKIYCWKPRNNVDVIFFFPSGF